MNYHIEQVQTVYLTLPQAVKPAHHKIVSLTYMCDSISEALTVLRQYREDFPNDQFRLLCELDK